MWAYTSNPIGAMKLKKNVSLPCQASAEVSDDDVCSNMSRDQELECPICCESFNIVENVPYVLWCGHTLCRNCVFALEWISLKFPFQRIRIPCFISCPWCNCLSFRLVYKGNLKFPRKNFFLLWLVEGLNAGTLKSFSQDRQTHYSLNSSTILENQGSSSSPQRSVHKPFPGHREFDNDNGASVHGGAVRGLHIQEVANLFIQFINKLPLVFILVLIIFLVIPACAFTLVIYLLITALIAVPSLLVLYCSYPVLDWLIRSITA